jgi:Tfp pilus assembly PilM family ATPase
MEAVMPSFDDLANEILLSFDYFENQFDREVEEVYLSGGGAQMTGIEEALERALNRPTHRWDPTEGIDIHEGTVDYDRVRQGAGQLAVAVGLASRVQEL